MATINRFEDLKCWQHSRELRKLIFQFISKEPFSKDYSLKNQINDSSGSAMDNIAEGFERDGRKEFIQFLSIAKGSVGETRSQLYRAFDRVYITRSEFDSAFNLVTQISNSTNGLINYLNSSEIKGVKYKVEEDEIEYGNKL